MAFINGHIVRKMFHMSLETCHATKLSSSRKQIGSFSFFLLKKQQCVVEQQLYWISQEKDVNNLSARECYLNWHNTQISQPLCGEMCFVGKCSQRGELQTDQGRLRIKNTYPCFSCKEDMEVVIKRHDRVIRNPTNKLVECYLSWFQKFRCKSIKVLCKWMLLWEWLEG